MRSTPEALILIVSRAALYALAIAALVCFAPGADYVFIYQGF